MRGFSGDGIFYSLLVTYSAMHFFVFWHAKALLPDRWLVLVPTILFLALMVVSPIAVRLLEKNGSFQSAHWVANVGYWWMGFLFLSFCGLLLVRALSLLVRFASAAFSSAIPSLAGPTPILAVFGIALALCVYGYFEARSIRVERMRIETPKLPVGGGTPQNRSNIRCTPGNSGARSAVEIDSGSGPRGSAGSSGVYRGLCGRPDGSPEWALRAVP